MNFVANVNDQCAQCCIAMLAGRNLRQVETDMGGALPNLSFDITLGQLEAYGLRLTVHRTTDGSIDFARHRVTPLASFDENATLLCRLIVYHPSSGDLWRETGHIVIIHKGDLYDPSLDRAYPLPDALRQWAALGERVFFNTAFEVRNPPP